MSPYQTLEETLAGVLEVPEHQRSQLNASVIHWLSVLKDHLHAEARLSNLDRYPTIDCYNDGYCDELIAVWQRLPQAYRGACNFLSAIKERNACIVELKRRLQLEQDAARADRCTARHREMELEQFEDLAGEVKRLWNENDELRKKLKTQDLAELLEDDNMIPESPKDVEQEPREQLLAAEAHWETQHDALQAVTREAESLREVVEAAKAVVARMKTMPYFAKETLTPEHAELWRTIDALVVAPVVEQKPCKGCAEHPDKDCIAELEEEVSRYESLVQELRVKLAQTEKRDAEKQSSRYAQAETITILRAELQADRDRLIDLRSKLAKAEKREKEMRDKYDDLAAEHEARMSEAKKEEDEWTDENIDRYVRSARESGFLPWAEAIKRRNARIRELCKRDAEKQTTIFEQAEKLLDLRAKLIELQRERDFFRASSENAKAAWDDNVRAIVEHTAREQRDRIAQCVSSWQGSPTLGDAVRAIKLVTLPRPEITRSIYSQDTKLAHGAVIEAGICGPPERFVLALRQLATMVHCDLTGELREPHSLKPCTSCWGSGKEWHDPLQTKTHDYSKDCEQCDGTGKGDNDKHAAALAESTTWREVQDEEKKT